MAVTAHVLEEILKENLTGGRGRSKVPKSFTASEEGKTHEIFWAEIFFNPKACSIDRICGTAQKHRDWGVIDEDHKTQHGAKKRKEEEPKKERKKSRPANVPAVPRVVKKKTERGLKKKRKKGFIKETKARRGAEPTQEKKRERKR